MNGRYDALFQPAREAIRFNTNLRLQFLLDQREQEQRKAEREQSNADLETRETERVNRRDMTGRINDIRGIEGMTPSDIAAINRLGDFADTAGPSDPRVRRLMDRAEQHAAAGLNRAAAAEQRTDAGETMLGAKQDRYDQLFRQVQDTGLPPETVNSLLAELNQLNAELGYSTELPQSAESMPGRIKTKQATAEDQARTDADTAKNEQTARETTRKQKQDLVKSYIGDTSSPGTLETDINRLEKRIADRKAYTDVVAAGGDIDQTMADDRARLRFQREELDRLRELNRALIATGQPDTVEVASREFTPPDPATRPAPPAKGKRASDDELRGYVQALTRWNPYGDQAWIESVLTGLGLSSKQRERLQSGGKEEA